MKRPSYLFGTIHDQDKKLFNFGDSVYAAIDKVDGLALEIDFDQFVDSMFNSMFKLEEKKVVERTARQDEEIDVPPIDSMDSVVAITDSVALTEVAIDSVRFTPPVVKDTKITPRPAVRKVSWTNNQMETIVDGYLYGVAQRKSKWLGGIEDPEDQMGLMDEFGNIHIDQNDQLNKNSQGFQLKQLKEFYIHEDLGKFAAILNASSESEFIQKALLQRNIKMARRMDSLMNIRTMFFAVGTAHLPGHGGLIELLRAKGFQVTPVFSSKKIQATSYLTELSKKEWVNNAIENLGTRYQTPMKVQTHSMFEGLFNMDVCFDLSSATGFMVGYWPTGKDSQMKLDSTLSFMLDNMGALKIGKPENIVRPLKGVQQKFSISQGYGFIRLMADERTMYMQFTTCGSPSAFFEAQSMRFFNSLVPGHAVKNLAGYDIPYKDSRRGFTIMLNAKPVQDKEQTLADGSLMVTMVSMDKNNAHAYALIARDEFHSVKKDSEVLVSRQDYYNSICINPNFTFFKTPDGFSCMRAAGMTKGAPNYTESYVIVRGTQLLIAGEVIGNGSAKDVEAPLIDRLSFSKLNLPAYSDFTDEGMHYSSFARLGLDTSAGNIQVYSVTDRYTGTAYQIIKQKLYEHAWTDSSAGGWLKAYTQRFSDGDSTLDSHAAKNGNLPSWQCTSVTEGSSVGQVVRAIMQGDTVVMIRGWADLSLINDPAFNAFFNDFKFVQERPTRVYTPQLKAVLMDIRSTDSATVEAAVRELQDHQFTKADLPVLHQALLAEYPSHNEGIDPYSRLSYVIQRVNDPSSADYAAKAYSRLSPSMQRNKYDLLRLIALQQDRKHMDMMIDLMKKGLPEDGFAFQLYTALRDSLKLTASYFPQLVAVRGGAAYRDMLMGLGYALLMDTLIERSVFDPIMPELLNTVKAAVDSISQNEDSYYNYSRPINWMLAMRNEDSKRTLRQLWPALKTSWNLNNVAVTALMNHLDVPQAVIDTLARDTSARETIWMTLCNEKKTELFPAQYRNAVAIGQSMIYNLVEEDVASPVVKYLKEMKSKSGGRYLIYIISSGEEEDETDEYFAVVGPDITADNLCTINEKGYVYYADVYQPGKEKELLEALLAEQKAMEAK